MARSLSTTYGAVAIIVLLVGLAIQTLATLDGSIAADSAKWDGLPDKLEAMSRISVERFQAVDELLAGRRSLT